jgi:glycerol-3-phosphate dehydrogenase
MEQESPAFTEKISPKYDYTIGEVVWAVREEMARTVDDVLARRVRMLFIDAREALAVAPKVAHVMAAELGKDETWEAEQVDAFTKIAKNYIVE